MATSCQYEFQLKLFGFSDAKPESFYTSQWFENRIAFVCYRCFMFLYTVIWSINTTIFYAQQLTNYYGYLSNWAEWSLIVYFGIALGVSIYGLVKHKKALTHADSDSRPSCSGIFKDDLQWFHRLCWVVFSAIFSIEILVTIVYWSFLSHIATSSPAANIHQHVMNTVLMLIDLFVNAVPIRLLHVIYAMMYGVTYTLFTLILHGAGVMSVYYPGLLDWRSSPGASAGLCIGLVVAAIPITHSVVFGLYHLRMYIARLLTNPKPAAGANDLTGGGGETNQAYELHS